VSLKPDLASRNWFPSVHLLVLEKYITAKVRWHLLARRSSSHALHDLVQKASARRALCAMGARPKKWIENCAVPKYTFNRPETFFTLLVVPGRFDGPRGRMQEGCLRLQSPHVLIFLLLAGGLEVRIAYWQAFGQLLLDTSVWTVPQVCFNVRCLYSQLGSVRKAL
jgi:hypothetical protein